MFPIIVCSKICHVLRPASSLSCDCDEIGCLQYRLLSYSGHFYAPNDIGSNYSAASALSFICFCRSFRLVLTRRQRGSAGSPVPNARFPIPTKLEYFFFLMIEQSLHSGVLSLRCDIYRGNKAMLRNVPDDLMACLSAAPVSSPYCMERDA